MTVDLSGRVALVTGASRGIGRAIACALARAGAEVCVNYLCRADAARATLALIEAAGGRGSLHQADVRDAEAVRAMVETLTARTGRLDILVTAAGIVWDGLLATLSDEAWRTVLHTNLDGTMHCCRAALPPMLHQGGGRIVVLSSISARRGSPGHAGYAASKGGVEATARALAVEVARKGITVNAIAPGLIETDMSREVIERRGDRLLGAIPMGRPGRPEDVAPLAVFLASDQARYLTGQVIGVNGGAI